MDTYQAWPAIGSGRLTDLSVSPLYYHWRLEQPDDDTEPLRRGAALHTAVLEPDLFDELYVEEPDPAKVAPDYQKPRATKAFKEAVRSLEASGRTVLRKEVLEEVRAMAAMIHGHKHAAKLLAKAEEREASIAWSHEGRLCRSRPDILGKRFVVNVKTTRSIERFSPWVISDEKYYLAAGHEVNGLIELNWPIDFYYFIAVESCPPHDVGVFHLEQSDLYCGQIQAAALINKLIECERTNTWPGQFPDVTEATISDRLRHQLGEPLEV